MTEAVYADSVRAMGTMPSGKKGTSPPDESWQKEQRRKL